MQIQPWLNCRMSSGKGGHTGKPILTKAYVIISHFGMNSHYRMDWYPRVSASSFALILKGNYMPANYWPRMTKQLTNFISQCEVCNAHPQAQPRESLISHAIPTRHMGTGKDPSLPPRWQRLFSNCWLLLQFLWTWQIENHDQQWSHWQTQTTFCKTWCARKSDLQ